MRAHYTHSVRPELVEGLSFFSAPGEGEGQGFDKLSPNGVGMRFAAASSRGAS
jgi:hypothetical protein